MFVRSDSIVLISFDTKFTNYTFSVLLITFIIIATTYSEFSF